MVSFFRTLTDLGRKALVGSTEMRVWCALLLAAASFSADAQTRTYAGPFSTNWRTVGKHGHDQPWCAEPTVTNFPNGGVLVHTLRDANMPFRVLTRSSHRRARRGRPCRQAKGDQVPDAVNCGSVGAAKRAGRAYGFSCRRTL